MSLFCGFLFNDLIIGNGSDFLFFQMNTPNFIKINIHLGNMIINLLALFYSLLGIIFILVFYNKKHNYFLTFLLNPFQHKKLNLISINTVYTFLSQRWFINTI